MNGILWILTGGITGWLTGKLIGENGYGKVLGRGYAKGLDIVFGIVGASFGGYLFFWTIIGEGSSFSGFATAVLGSITVVGFVWQVSAGYLPFSLVYGREAIHSVLMSAYSDLQESARGY